MSIFSKGSDEAIADANRMDRAETADALRRRASDEFAAGNMNAAGELIHQAIDLEDGLGAGGR